MFLLWLRGSSSVINICLHHQIVYLITYLISEQPVKCFCFYYLPLFLLTHDILHHRLLFLYCRALAGQFKQQGWTWLWYVSSDWLTKNKSEITGTLYFTTGWILYDYTMSHLKKTAPSLCFGTIAVAYSCQRLFFLFFMAVMILPLPG